MPDGIRWEGRSACPLCETSVGRPGSSLLVSRIFGTVEGPGQLHQCIGSVQPSADRRSWSLSRDSARRRTAPSPADESSTPVIAFIVETLETRRVLGGH